MNNNRRNFLKISAVAGLSMAGSGYVPLAADSMASPDLSKFKDTLRLSKQKHKQKCMMSGNAARPWEKVRFGFIGCGSRGPAAVVRMSKIDGVEIKAL